jgi:hypothetical protein
MTAARNQHAENKAVIEIMSRPGKGRKSTAKMKG